MPVKRLTAKKRREIFHSLVETQDVGLMTVPQSRQQIMKRYDITEDQLRRIEEEGIDQDWPPLDLAGQPRPDRPQKETPAVSGKGIDAGPAGPLAQGQIVSRL